jgi:hypothetical protein
MNVCGFVCKGFRKDLCKVFGIVRGLYWNIEVNGSEGWD